MTLAKAVVSGTIYRTPEKRFTQNDIAVYDFTLNIDEREETLIRVISKRRMLAEILDNVKKGDKIIVEGRLQTASSKAADGTDRKFFEIDANSIELMSAGGSAGGNKGTAESNTASEVKEELVKFSETDYTEDTLIDDEEIPF